jgi:hypothetical protein
LLDRYGRTVDSMSTLHQVIAGMSDPFRRHAFHTALISDWAQVDPAGGLRFFLRERADARQRGHFFGEWLRQDALAAVDTLMISGSGWEKLAREFLPEIARQLPSRAPEITSRLPASDDYWENSVSKAFAILAESGLEAAIRQAESVSGPNRDQALAGVAQVWAKRDFHAAMGWAGELPEGIDRDEIIRAALLGQAAVDPIIALEYASLVPAGGRHAHFASTTGARVLAEAAQADFDATVAWLTQHPERFHERDLQDGLARAVSQRLNSEAAGFLTEQAWKNSLGVLVPAIGDAVLNQASGQRQAIWDWLKHQPESEPARILARAVLMTAAFQQPSLALSFVEDLPGSIEPDDLLKLAAQSLFNGGRRLDRFDLFFDQAPDDLRVPLAESAFQFLYAGNLDDPQEWIARLSLLPEASRGQGIERLARAWSGQNPEEALAWAGSMGAGENRTRALAAITANWANKDPYGAAEWVASMPSGAERDRSAGALAGAITEWFPHQAWSWALSIHDPQERSRAAAQAVKSMARRDSRTAREWIEQGPFSQELRESLSADLERGAFSSNGP